MFNWKFVQAQFKNTWIIILSFGLTFAILIGSVNIFPLFADKAMNEIVNGREVFYSPVSGASEYINNSIFGLSSITIFFAFGITMSMVLINTDINRGYITSWLTTPMSRKGLFNSKLFVLISSVFILNVWMVLAEMVSFSIRMEDFKIGIGRILLGNLSLLCLSLMIVSGSWIVFSLFQKNALALGLLLGLCGWFMLCYILIQLSANPYLGLQNLKYFKYFTIQSLFNSPLMFDKRPELPTTEGKHVVYTPLSALQAKDFVWQLPLMLGTSIGLSIGGQFIIKNKDFAF